MEKKETLLLNNKNENLEKDKKNINLINSLKEK